MSLWRLSQPIITQVRKPRLVIATVRYDFIGGGVFTNGSANECAYVTQDVHKSPRSPDEIGDTVYTWKREFTRPDNGIMMRHRSRTHAKAGKPETISREVRSSMCRIDNDKHVGYRRSETRARALNASRLPVPRGRNEIRAIEENTRSLSLARARFT